MKKTKTRREREREVQGHKKNMKKQCKFNLLLNKQGIDNTSDSLSLGYVLTDKLDTKDKLAGTRASCNK